MNHARTRRGVIWATLTTIVAGLLSFAVIAPAHADVTSSALELTPEVSVVGITTGVNITARLVDSTTGVATPQTAAITIDFEYEGGTVSPDVSPTFPDNSCVIAITQSECQITITASTASTSLIRAWVREPGFVDQDATEERLSNVTTDCATEQSPAFADCVDAEAEPGTSAERDQTDVVSVQWTAGAAQLNCEPETQGKAIGDDTARITCTVRDANGAILPSQRVDGENLDSANDPDSDQTAGDPDYEDNCDESSACVFVIDASPGGDRNDQAGTARLCFWVDTDNDANQPTDDAYDPEGPAADGGLCDTETADASENANTTDTVTITWGGVETTLDVTPESLTGTVGTTHTFTATVLDQFGTEYTAATPVALSFGPGSVHSSGAGCTTAGSGAHPGQCTFTVTSNSVGLDVICAYFGAAPSASCNGETVSGGINTARIDSVSAAWSAAATTTTSTAPTTTTTSTPPAEDVSKTQGYTLVGADGGIFNFGTSQFHGSTGSMKLNQPVIGLANKKGGTGYWLVAKDGGIFTFGDAEFFGSTGDKKLNAPILGMEATPSGKGYYLFAADGGIFTFGDADFHGSTGDMKLNAPAVGLSINSKGDGYWLVAQDGGIFSFGNVPFHGSTGSMKLNQPVFDMAPTAGDKGYWLVAKDGGIFSFGDAESKFHGSAVGSANGTVIGMGTTPTFNGYWIADSAGGVFPFGDARALGDRRGQTNNAPIVGFATVPKA